MEGLARCVITHEGHTVMCATPTDARFVVESVNALISSMETMVPPTYDEAQYLARMKAYGVVG